MEFISHLLRSSSSQNLPYSCASDFEINRRGDHRPPVLQTRNFNRGPRKAKAFWGKGVNCAKHKRHVAPNLLLRSVAKFGYGGPRKVKAFWGKGERNEVFIMNFKEIHSNTEFLWTSHRFEPKYPIGTRKQYDGLS